MKKFLNSNGLKKFEKFEFYHYAMRALDENLKMFN